MPIVNKIENRKELQEALEIVTMLHQDNSICLLKDELSREKISAKLIKKDTKGFTLHLPREYSTDFNLEAIENISTSIGLSSINIDKVIVTSISNNGLECKVESFHENGFKTSDKYFYRLIIPLKKKLTFTFHIDQILFQVGTMTSRECTRITYDNLSMDLFLFETKDESYHYLILDTTTELSFDDFQDYCFYTLVTFGYVTGDFPQNEGYYFAYQTNELKKPKYYCYREFRDSINTNLSPIYANAGGYTKNHELISTLNKTLRTISLEEFSKLCNHTYNSVEFSSTLLLILEASASTLILMPAGLSVALERLSKLIVKENEEKKAVIKNLELENHLRDDLKAVIAKYSFELKKEENVNYSNATEILVSRIGSINRSKKTSNIDNLEKPFEILKFNLSKEDKTAIKHRNDFLHGEINIGGTKPLLDKGRITDISRKTYCICLRLYTLLTVLILKPIGYNNKIVNHPKLAEDLCNKKLDEEIFRQI